MWTLSHNQMSEMLRLRVSLISTATNPKTMTSAHLSLVINSLSDRVKVRDLCTTPTFGEEDRCRV